MRGNVQRRSSRSSSRNRRSSSRRYEEPKSNPLNALMIGVMICGGVYYVNPDIVDNIAPILDNTNTWINKFINKDEEVSSPLSYTMPALEANIVKILATTLYDEQDMQEFIGDEWYSKYYRVLQANEEFTYLTEDGANNRLTHDLSSQIIQDIVGTQFSVNIDTNNATLEVSFEQFLEVYSASLEAVGKGNLLEFQTLSIIQTYSSDLLPWNVLTSDGIYNFEGLILDSFVDYTLEVAVAQNNILGITRSIDTKSILEQCYIISVDGDTAIIQVGDKNVSYKHTGISKDYEGSIMNLQVQAGTILDFVKYIEEIGDIILRITNEYIEFAGIGKYSYGNVKIFDQVGDWLNITQVAAGSRVEYVIDNNQVVSLKIIDYPDSDNIRVIITEDGFGDYNHDNVILSMPINSTVIFNDTTMLIADGTWDSSNFNWSVGDKVIITSEDNPITITSITRQGINPSYYGTLEIYKDTNGYTIINNVDMTNYLAGVIPSEMPTSFGLEACKVQAIAARSYTIASQSNSQFAKYGAQVDDTVATQVYNNIAQDNIAYEAAKSTEGMVLTYEGQVISGNFFSTSAGYTANFGEVWSADTTFPMNTPVYLSSRQQYTGDSIVADISTEANAYTFFTTPADKIDAFDNHAARRRVQCAVSTCGGTRGTAPTFTSTLPLCRLFFHF